MKFVVYVAYYTFPSVKQRNSEFNSMKIKLKYFKINYMIFFSIV